MRKNILVIGGTRFFGKLLVQRLLAAGHAVTIATRGRAQDPFGERVKRIVVDRGNEQAMCAAFAGIDGYDIVYDQVCNSPQDAAIAVKVFAHKVKRYVMASSIQVYRDLVGRQKTSFAETDLNVMALPIDTAYPWHKAALSGPAYANGKRQAEAYLYRDGTLPVVTVRIGHVLAGPEDYTGRLGHYVDLVRQNAPLRYSNAAATSSFLSSQVISHFMAWVGTQDFVGPVNAACDGSLSAFDIYQRVGAALEVPVAAIPQAPAAAAAQPSPFDYASPFVMDTSRAFELGYQFSHCDDWLDDLIRMHDLAFA